jgi:hypothetical protein
MHALRTNGDSGDGGDPVVPIPIMNHRRLADRAPGLPNRRDQEEARRSIKTRWAASLAAFFHGARRIVSMRRWPLRCVQ